MSYKVYPRKTESPGSGAVIVTNESCLKTQLVLTTIISLI